MANSAIRLDGTSNKLTAAVPIDYDQNYELAVWVRLPVTPTAWGGVLSVYRDTNNVDAVECDDAGAFDVSSKAGGTYDPVDATPAQPSANTWFYLGFQRNSTGYAVYVDGVLKGTLSHSGGTRGGAAVSLQLGDWAGTGELLRADYAYVRAWQTTLTDTERNAERLSATAVKSGALMDEPLQSVGALGAFTASGTVTTTDGPTAVGSGSAGVTVSLSGVGFATAQGLSGESAGAGTAPSGQGALSGTGTMSVSANRNSVLVLAENVAASATGALAGTMSAVLSLVAAVATSVAEIAGTLAEAALSVSGLSSSSAIGGVSVTGGSSVGVLGVGSYSGTGTALPGGDAVALPVGTVLHYVRRLAWMVYR